jgi:predicted O-methyltransferase YrrM
MDERLLSYLGKHFLHSTKIDDSLFIEIKKLVDKHNIQTIIETGTFMGGSTSLFSKMVKEVKTIEFYKEYYELTKNSLKSLTNITFYNGESHLVLNEILTGEEKNILFFLDAHGFGTGINYVPVYEELKVIALKKIKPIIVIHDFIVPNKNYKETFEELSYEKIKEFLVNIYGEDEYIYHYLENSLINRGAIFVEKK